MATSYRIYQNHSIQGPYNLDELLKVENLSKETLVCEVGDIEWEEMGSCKSIQQQFAMQPMKWGAVQQALLNVSASPPANPGSARAISNSGDFVQTRRQPSRSTPGSQSKPAPDRKGGIFSKIISILNTEV